MEINSERGRDTGSRESIEKATDGAGESFRSESNQALDQSNLLIDEQPMADWQR